jgi:integrase
MPRLTSTLPKYRKHRASGQAVVTLSGRDFYLGPHGTKASKMEYDRLVSEWLQCGRCLPQQNEDLTVVEVLAAYKRHAETYYRKNGKPTREVGCIVEASQHVIPLYGKTPAIEFGPLALQVIQQRMIESGYCRIFINKQIGRIKRAFKWAVSQELISGESLPALQAVSGLRKGRTDARETDPVLPVDDGIVNATLPKLPPVVADMVRFQRLTGCRPGEVCALRPSDVDRSADVWAYRPESHKTQHHERGRVVFIGPKAQAVLLPYLLRGGNEYCFSPVDSERKRRAEMHESRKTPLSCGNRPGSNRKTKPARTAGACYTADSYRRAVHRACELAEVEKWAPNQLRHSAGTEVRQKYGLEAAQVILGHSKADVTQVYAERDMEKAAGIMREIG